MFDTIMFDIIENGIAFLSSFSNCSLLVYGNTTYFDMFIFILFNSAEFVY